VLLQHRSRGALCDIKHFAHCVNHVYPHIAHSCVQLSAATPETDCSDGSLGRPGDKSDNSHFCRDVMGSKDVIQFARQNFKKRLDAQAIADKLAQVCPWATCRAI